MISKINLHLLHFKFLLEADENGSFKLKQTNPALKDVFLQDGNVNSNNASNWDPSIIQEGTGDTATGTKNNNKRYFLF